jgi:hypothetical protein
MTAKADLLLDLPLRAGLTTAPAPLRNPPHLISPHHFYIAPMSPSTLRASDATAGFLALSPTA